MRIIFLLLASTISLTATDPAMMDFAQNQKIGVQNAILAKVNGNTISMIDVKKKMDMLFHQSYSHLEHSNQARFQFYEMSWRPVLMEMIDNELILSDATDKEIKLTDGEIREEIEHRFGPNVTATLDKIGLSYDETWKLIKNEMIARRMTWWFAHSRALSSVTPQDIRQSYRRYLQENPSYAEWKYRVVSIHADKPDEKFSEEIYQLLAASKQAPDTLATLLKKKETPSRSIHISNEYNASDKQLSDAHKAALISLTPGNYSKPSFQLSRVEKKTVYRIFYLIDKVDHSSPSFEHLSLQLRDQLTQKAIAKETQVYLDRLRKHYGYDASHLSETIPEDLHPFSLQ